MARRAHVEPFQDSQQAEKMSDQDVTIQTIPDGDVTAKKNAEKDVSEEIEEEEQYQVSKDGAVVLN
jgi:hypothetical protein